MYRLLVVLVTVNLVVLCSGHFGHRHGHHHGPGSHGHGHHPGCHHDENEHTRVMREFLEANERLKKFCNDFSKVEPLITYGTNAVDIEYALPAGSNAEVTITDTVLKANVTNKTNGQDTVAFTDVRVLPDILDFNKATLLTLDNKLKITIPYRIKLQEQFTAKCGSVNNTVITVPNMPAFIYRISKDEPRQY